MKEMRNLVIGTLFVVVLCGLGIGQSLLEKTARAQSQNAVQAPRFEVDPMWPNPLPNGWILGMTIGVWADSRDHVWIVHRADTLDAIEGAASQNPPTGECCTIAPPVMEFDQAGILVQAWGGKDGPGYTWPGSNHGIFVDNKDNVWLGGNGGDDGLVLKFTRAGKFVAQFGKRGVTADSNAMDHFSKVAKIFVDEKANEAYISDGYGNKRVAVIDVTSGAIKRYWGAYGNKPDDTNIGRYDPAAPPAQQFRNPVHCADVSVDGFVYVCDRANDRLQVFTKAGKFVKEVFVQKESRGEGSVFDVAFSKDPQQKYLYMADATNSKVRIFDRLSLTELTNFGEGGHYAGQFYEVHSIATDSKGNIYTTETYQGRRVQKFTYKGLAPVVVKEQGTVWPRTTGQ